MALWLQKSNLMASTFIRAVSNRFRGYPPIARRCFTSEASREAVRRRSLGQPTAYSHPFLMKEKEVTPGLTQENYKERRQNLVELILNEKQERIVEKHLIVVLGSPITYMTQDIPYMFHQNTNFLYLTGFQEPDSCLVIEAWNSDVKCHQSTLFVPKRDLLKELWNGSRAGTDGALQHTGVDHTDEIDNLGSFLKSAISKDMVVWYDYTRMANLQLHLNKIRGFLQEAQKEGVKIRQIQDPLHEQRNIKTPEECALMSKAGEIVSEAFIDAMSYSKPGMNESAIHARLEYKAKVVGAQMLAFPPVVAGGSRANTLHYVVNNQNIADGSLVLVDAGAYYHGYVSDVTRTWPINGRFSEPQQLLYEAVLRIQRLCIGLCRPGQSLDEIYHTMSMALAKELYDTGVYIGESEMKAESQFRGIGIRIEDDVLVTAGDPVVLTEKCPKDVQDIENIMAA